MLAMPEVAVLGTRVTPVTVPAVAVEVAPAERETVAELKKKAAAAAHSVPAKYIVFDENPIDRGNTLDCPNGT